MSHPLLCDSREGVPIAIGRGDEYMQPEKMVNHTTRFKYFYSSQRNKGFLNERTQIFCKQIKYDADILLLIPNSDL